MNYVFLAGTITDKFDLRAVKDTHTVNFTVEVASDKSKNYIRCNAWGDQAKIVDKMQKGDYVVVVGQTVTSSYEKNGQKIRNQEVRANKIGKMDLTVGRPAQAVYAAPAPVAPPEPVPAVASADDYNVPF